MLHTGITSGCITCHGSPNATAPVFYLNFTPKPASGLSPVHIPTSTTACESCHTATDFTGFGTPLTTMTSAKHTAMFAVIGKTCDGCHDASTLKFYGVTNLTTRPSGHHVGQDCSGCHNTNNWNGGAASNKKTATTTTTSSKVTAVVAAPTTTTSAAKAATNIVAPRSVRGDRGDHALGDSLPAVLADARGMTISHAGVTANCASCHNGVLATGKGPTHIASNALCQNCHTTTAWLPARFDHQGVTASCVTCHNGAVAPGKPTRHVQTTQDCGTCHNTLNWQSVAFNHVGIVGTCVSCHNGVTASGKQPQHVLTTQDCGSCHNTLNWTVIAAPNTLRPLLRGGGHNNPTSGPKQ